MLNHVLCLNPPTDARPFVAEPRRILTGFCRLMGIGALGGCVWGYVL